ncbi:MAG TPA: VanZ family protein [Bacillota bacterium]|nr:VanZ family protein [Bacillota bacterium]
MKRKSIHRVLAWSIALFWMGVIFYLSHQPGEASSELSSGIVKFVVEVLSFAIPKGLIEIKTLHLFVRKFAHFFAYFLLGVFILHAVLIDRSMTFRTALFVYLFTILYAISDEVHQLFIPGRSGEVRDVIIDSFGSATGISLYSFGRKVWQRKRRAL